MKPEYIGVGNFDEDNYVYAYCKCPLSVNYAIKWPRIKDGKVHSYTCTCEECGTEVGVISKSYGPEVLSKEPCTDAISRQAVLMEIDKYLCGVPFEEKGIDEVIKDLPLVTPAEKMGRWIDADVLDKIRAEIEEYRDTMPWESKSLVKWEAINYILEQIIDKYKANPTGEEE